MMYTLKTPAFLRSSSRPSSPPTGPMTQQLSSSGDSDNGIDHRAPRPLTRAFTLTSLSRKASPAPVRSATPTPLVQDGSYLESLSLKLSEAVTKAIVQPPGTAGPGASDVLNGKRPIPPDRGRALGELIAAELHASQGKIHLQRAILRSLHRPLSVLITNLSSILLPLLSSPAFLNPPGPTASAPNPNPTQAHALGIAGFAGELLDCLDGLDLDVSHDHRGDGLNNFREGLVSIIGRVMNPLIGGLKGDLLPLLRALEAIRHASLSTASAKPANGSKAAAHQHPSIISLQALMPVYAKALRRYTTSKVMQSTLATFLISAIWTTLVALSHRPTVPRSRSNSVSAASATSSAFKLRLSSSTTPPPTPPANRFTMKLPGSRPPSPVHTPVLSTASDAHVMYDLLSMLPKPTPMDDASRVALEAVDEAFEALGALTALLSAIDSGGEVREDFDLEVLTEGLPMLIALPVLLRWSGHGESQVIPAMLGIEEREYREGCLSGFGRADECETMVAQRMVGILRNDVIDDMKTKMVVEYLESCVEH